MIALRIRKYLLKNDISEKNLCEKIEISENLLKLKLSGQRKMTLDEYEKICNALDVSLSFFFEDYSEGG